MHIYMCVCFLFPRLPMGFLRHDLVNKDMIGLYLSQHLFHSFQFRLYTPYCRSVVITIDHQLVSAGLPICEIMRMAVVYPCIHMTYMNGSIM